MGLWCCTWEWIACMHVMGMEQVIWLQGSNWRHAQHQWMVGFWILWSHLVVGLAWWARCQWWPEVTWMMAWSITLSWLQSLSLDHHWDGAIGFQDISWTCHSRWLPAGRNVQMCWQLWQVIGRVTQWWELSARGWGQCRLESHWRCWSWWTSWRKCGRWNHPDGGWTWWHDCWRMTRWWWWGSCWPAPEHGTDCGCQNEWWAMWMSH